MSNTLYISQHEAITETGFLSRNLGEILLQNKNTIIDSLPNFNNLNISNDLSSVSIKEKLYHIDRIIQYLPIDTCEYIGKYKNIIIYNPFHFITHNKSIKDKLQIFDEIWVFDENNKIFIDIDKNIKVIGYPYIPSHAISFFDQHHISLTDNQLVFYTIIQEHQIENMESLIMNFINVFHKNSNIKLIIYLDTELTTKTYDTLVGAIINRVKNTFSFINPKVVDEIITVLVGNIWIDHDAHKKLHNTGHCYINLEYKINPHVLTAFHLNKYCISINNISNILQFKSDNIIQTYRGSFRFKPLDKYNNIYFNEYNLYPKILDESIKEKLISIYNRISNGIDCSSCYQAFNDQGYCNKL